MDAWETQFGIHIFSFKKDIDYRTDNLRNMSY